jgi:Fur family peroxide stress response transcriptional regulator
MRQTRQRAAILTILHQTDEHPTADWIHREVRKTLPRVSLGTVYRTLDVLCREGVVNALRTDARSCRYDGNPGDHAHIVCTQCGRIADVESVLPPAVLQNVAEATGFQVQGQKLEWYGVCRQCMNDRAESERKN